MRANRNDEAPRGLHKPSTISFRATSAIFRTQHLGVQAVPKPPNRHARITKSLLDHRQHPSAMADFDLDLTDTIAYGFRYPDTLPELRYDDGDTMIKLGGPQDEWLLLHKRALVSNIPVLGAMLRWPYGDKPVVVHHPNSHDRMLVQTLSLKYVDKTFVLNNSKDVSFAPKDRYDIVEFHCSELASGWPTKSMYSCSNESRAALAHRALFAILYGYPVSLRAIMYEGHLHMDRHDVDHYGLHEAIMMVAEIGAYAEYYDCLSCVAQPLLDALRGHRFFSQLVAAFPPHCFHLATKLRDHRLYFEAPRHLIAAAPTNEYENMGNILSMTQDECKAWVEPITNRMSAKIAALQGALISLQLFKSYSVWGKDYEEIRTTYQILLDNHRARDEIARASRASTHLAKNIYSQWLTQQLYGSDMWLSNWCGKPRSARTGSLAPAIQSLERAAGWSFPAALFGKDTVKTYIQDFGQGMKRNPKVQVTAALNALDKEAASIIQRQLPVREEEINGKTLTYRRTEYMDKFENVT